MVIKAGDFKAKCLKLMDHVKEFHEEIIITKRGKPVAKLIPVEDNEKRKTTFGFLKDSVKINEDIIVPIHDVEWDALN